MKSEEKAPLLYVMNDYYGETTIFSKTPFPYVFVDNLKALFPIRGFFGDWEKCEYIEGEGFEDCGADKCWNNKDGLLNKLGLVVMENSCMHEDTKPSYHLRKALDTKTEEEIQEYQEVLNAYKEIRTSFF